MTFCNFINFCFLFVVCIVIGQTFTQTMSAPTGTSTMESFTDSSTAATFVGECSTIAAVDSCNLWDINAIIVLDNRSDALVFQAVQSFLTNLTTNCPMASDNSGSSLSLSTPASLNKSSNDSQCFSQEACTELIYSTKKNDTFVSASNQNDVIMNLFTGSFQNFLHVVPGQNNRGKVLYFITNVPGCITGECSMRNLSRNQWPLANYMNSNGIVFQMIYLEQFDDDGDGNNFDSFGSRKVSRVNLPFLNLAMSSVLSVFNELNDIAVYTNLNLFRRGFKDIQACPNIPPTAKDTTWKYFISYGVPAVASALIILCIGCVCFIKFKYKINLLKLRRRQVEVQAVVHANSIQQYHVSLNSYVNMDKNLTIEQKDKWEIAPHKLFIDDQEKLGTGAFSTVFKGSLKGKPPVFDVYEHRTFATDFIVNNEVAVKMLPTHADNDSKQDFLSEISFMKNLGYHTHIVSMIGCITNPKELCLVVEYCAKGDLLKFLRKHRTNFLMDQHESPADVEYCIRVKDLLSFAWQVSDGMEYLSSRDYIHRDVAARNILVTKKLAVKIGDFGLCRYVDQSLYTTKGGRLPIKWMSIESLKQGEYTTKSDVWSFGVFLFELFSLGDSPYPVLQPSEMLTYLEGGNRLSRPDICPENLYDLMKSCWDADPKRRPTFTDIRSTLTLMLGSATEHYGYLDVQVEEKT